MFTEIYIISRFHYCFFFSFIATAPLAEADDEEDIDHVIEI